MGPITCININTEPEVSNLKFVPFYVNQLQYILDSFNASCIMNAETLEVLTKTQVKHKWGKYLKVFH